LVLEVRAGEEGVLEVERWAELRREHFVRGASIRALAERSGLSRNTVRRALRSESPPTFRRPERPSKLDPFKDVFRAPTRPRTSNKPWAERLMAAILVV
jgi:transposase